MPDHVIILCFVLFKKLFSVLAMPFYILQQYISDLVSLQCHRYVLLSLFSLCDRHVETAHSGFNLCILSPRLFDFYAEYIMRNAGLEEAHTGIKIAGRNINTLKYADGTPLILPPYYWKNHSFD